MSGRLRRFDVAGSLRAVSLLGPDLGQQTSASLQTFIGGGFDDIIEIDLTRAMLLEYNFVNAFLPPILDQIAAKRLDCTLIVTCDIPNDGREIKKGLVWGAAAPMPEEASWTPVIASLKRWLVLRNRANNNFEYVGTHEPILLSLIAMITERGRLTARDLVDFGWPTALAADSCRELHARRQIIKAPNSANAEPVFVAIPSLFRSDDEPESSKAD